MMTGRIYHDMESVRKILPEVKEILKKIMGLHRSLEILDGIDVENVEDDLKLELAITDLNITFHKKMYLYHVFLRKLVSLGVIVKDLDMGLVDFYSRHDGKDILLCWMYGEEDVTHWHTLEDGFDGRQSVNGLRRTTSL